eukprot:CFRG8577T1
MKSPMGVYLQSRFDSSMFTESMDYPTQSYQGIQWGSSDGNLHLSKQRNRSISSLQTTQSESRMGDNDEASSNSVYNLFNEMYMGGSPSTKFERGVSLQMDGKNAYSRNNITPMASQSSLITSPVTVSREHSFTTNASSPLPLCASSRAQEDIIENSQRMLEYLNREKKIKSFASTPSSASLVDPVSQRIDARKLAATFSAPSISLSTIDLSKPPKRHRRRKNTLDLKFHCEFPGCQRKYASKLSRKQHYFLKHITPGGGAEASSKHID